MGLQNFLMNRLIENSVIGKKIQSGDNVSKKGQFALDATEKNPNIEDTMAEKIANLENETKRLDNSIKKVISLPNGASTGDGQIEDAKVGIEGESYDTLGDAIREQVKTYRDVDVSNTTPTNKARVWVNTSTNDTESQDILLPQVDDANISEENTWSSKKIDSEIGEVRNGIKYIMNRQIIIPENDSQIFDIFIPFGADFVINTVDGENFGVTTTIRLLRQDKTEIDYYTLYADTNHRDLVNDKEDIYYVKMQSGSLSKSVLISSNPLGTMVDTITDNTNILNEFVVFQRVKIPSGSVANYSAHIPQGTKFTVKTSSGENFGVTTTIRLLRQDKTEIDYYTLYADTNHRDLVNDKEDIYYVKMQSNTMTQPIEVIIKNTDVIESKVLSLETSNESVVKTLNELYSKFDNIPEFYSDYLKTRINTIVEKDLLIGNNGDSFIFITDLHNENNYYSPVLAKEICQRTSVGNIIYGGDYINEPSSKEAAIDYLTSRRTKCMGLDDVVFLMGNHDTNPYGTGRITADEFYSIFDKHSEKYIDTNKKTYFYSDNISQHIRYIYLDSGVNGDIDEAQVSWFGSVISQLDSSWTIVIFTHHGIYTGEKDNRTDIKEYPILTTIKEKLSDVIATVACIICGHTHIDLVDNSMSYPIICTTCDAHGIQSSSMSSDDRTVGTINEQAFDVFHIDTMNRKIYVTRIGGGQVNVITKGDYALNDRYFTY